MTYDTSNAKYKKLNKDLKKATDTLYEQVKKELDFGDNFGLLNMVTKGVGRLEGNVGFTVDTEEIVIPKENYGSIKILYSSNYKHETERKNIMLSLITIDTVNGKLTLPFRIGGGFAFSSGGEHYATHLKWKTDGGKIINSGYYFTGVEIDSTIITTIELEDENKKGYRYMLFPFERSIYNSRYFTTLYKVGKATITHLTYSGWRNNK